MVKIRRRIPTTYRPPNTSGIEKNTSCPRPRGQKRGWRWSDRNPQVPRIGRAHRIIYRTIRHAARSPDRTVPGGGSTKFRNRTRVARTDRVTGACLLIGPKERRNAGLMSLSDTPSAGPRFETCRQRAWRNDDAWMKKSGAAVKPGTRKTARKPRGSIALAPLPPTFNHPSRLKSVRGCGVRSLCSLCFSSCPIPESKLQKVIPQLA